MVIIDTSVWVQFFRNPGSTVGLEASRLVDEDQALLVGPILAELLQGTASREELEELEDALAALPYVEGQRSTWARVGQLALELRRSGLTIGLADLYIATVALEEGASVYTLDQDFERVPGLQLHQPG